MSITPLRGERILDKHSYNIDSILSEVKKRRQEQEDKSSSPSENQNTKNSMSVDADLKAAPQVKEPAPVVEPKAEEPAPVVEPKAEEPAPVVEPMAEEPAPVVEPMAEEQTQADEPLPEVKVDEEEPKIESDLTADGDKEAEMPPVSLDNGEEEVEMPPVSLDDDESEPIMPSISDDDGDSVDDSAIQIIVNEDKEPLEPTNFEHPKQNDDDDKKGRKKGNKDKKRKKSKKKNAKLTPEERKKKKKKKIMIIVTIIILVVIALAAGGWYVYDSFVKPVQNAKVNTQSTEQYKSTQDKLVESFDPIEETDASEIASLQDMIRKWYYNGTPCSSTHVYNVLLVGEDTRGKDVLDKGTRADSAIIASVNVDTKQITLTSVLRDAYTYFETKPGDESTGTFDKINAAMSRGDIDSYINCVERMYKINIDNYVIINFDAFESVIDELGGVTLELTSKEIREINNHPGTYGNVTIEKTFDGTKGKIKLNGKQALAYCRIRHIDSDNARADRQKTTLMEIFSKVKGSSKTEMIRVVKKLLPYTKMDIGMDTVLNIAGDAFSQNWMNYAIKMTSVPNYRINEKGAGGTYYGAWMWKSDFPQDAYYLQYVLYGKSSITLAKTRVDVLKCKEKGFFDEGSSPVTATLDNTAAYGEVSTTSIKSDDEK